jgi:hypothetical protein
MLDKVETEFDAEAMENEGSPAERNALYDAGANGVTPERSVADQLRQSFAVAKSTRTKDFQVPGYEPPLFLVLRGIDDFSELRKMIVDVVRKTKYLPKEQIAQQQIALGAATLIKAAVDSYVINDEGEKVVLGKKLGLELYDLIWPPDGSGSYRPMTDSEAVQLLFPLGSASLMTVAAAYDLWQKGTSFEVEDSLLGE